MQSKKRIICLLVVATIIKAIIIFFFYQHLVVYENGMPHIVSGYGWRQLIESMHLGQYQWIVQTGFSDVCNIFTQTFRPPLYSGFLFFLTLLDVGAAPAGILMQSIITSLVAYLGYLIVRLSNAQEKSAVICLITLFFFPINFLKSGTVDEAPLMLVFVLVALYLLGRYIQNQRKSLFLVFSGLLLGLSTMTRYTTLIIVIIIACYLLTSKVLRDKKYYKVFLFVLCYFLVLSPWLFRSYLIYGKPILLCGDARVLIFTQSKQFIEEFPKKSPDDIEREYMRYFYNKHKYLSQLDVLSREKELRLYALSEMIHSPGKFLHSLLVKFKVLNPFAYYPQGHNFLRNFVWIVSYLFSIFIFVPSLLNPRKFTFENKILLIVIIGTLIPGIIYFMTSRHLYPVMVFMIIFSFIIHSNLNSRHFLSSLKIMISKSNEKK